MSKKILRLILCVIMAFSLLPVTACKKTPQTELPNDPGNITTPDDGKDDDDDKKNDENPEESYDPFVDWTEITEWTPQNIKSRPVTKKDILIGSYFSFCDTAEQKSAKSQLKILADGGLNFLPLAENIPSFGLIEKGEKVRRDLQSAAWWKKIDDELVKRNMVYYYSSNVRAGYDYEPCANVEDMRNDHAREAAAKIVPQLENCIGYSIKDEPMYGEFESLAAIVKKYAEIKPGMDAYVNHLGGPGGYDGSYYGFLKEWANCFDSSSPVTLLSHDIYPFFENGITIAAAMQTAAEDMRKVSEENGGLMLGCYIQSCAFSVGGDKRRMTNFDEIKWQINSYLASGFSQFVYFNYAVYPNENCSDAIIGQKGNILHKDLYDALATYHLQLRAMGVNCRFTDLIAKKVWFTSAANKPGNVDQLPESSEYIMRDGLTDGNGFIVSYLTNASGKEKYLMLVNNSFETTYENKEFKVGAKASQLSKMQVYNLETGKFEDLWSAGQNSFALSFGKSDMKIIKLTDK